MTFQRGKGHSYDQATSDRMAREMLSGLKLAAEADSAKKINYKAGHERISRALRASSDTGGWLSKYATDLTLRADNTKVIWQEVELGETTEDHSFFECLWSMQLSRIGESDFQLSQVLIPQAAVTEHQRKVADDQANEFKRKLDLQKQGQERQSRIRRERREAGRCELCGRKIGPFSGLFGRIVRNQNSLYHWKCGNTYTRGPINC